jgi:outer membrane protein assembly factor BamB
VAYGKVVTLGVSSVLSCFDAASGKVLWRKDEFAGETPKFFTAMSPIVIDGMVIAHLGGEEKGTIFAFDLDKGNQKWKWTGDGPAYASPVLMTMENTKLIVVQTEKNLVGIAIADGKLLWQIPSPAEGRFYNSATPIVNGQTVIFTGQGHGTKAIKIQKEGDNFIAKELWSNEELGTAYNTPVLKDDWLYGLSNRGNLFCMNASTGKTAWVDDTDYKNFGAVLDAGSVILALPSNSELIAFKPDEKEYVALAQIKVADTPTYAHPVIAGKRIYVKDEETLTMWMVE